MTSAAKPLSNPPPASHSAGVLMGEKALEFPFGDALPAVGEALTVAPGILWIRLPLPFALDHINLWLLEDSEITPTGIRKGWTAVDCGVDNPVTQAAWEQVFAGPMKGLPILRVLATHMHPDHMGLAHWLCAKFNAPLLISATEYQSAVLASQGTSNFGGVGTQQFFSSNGWNNPDDQEKVNSRALYYNKMVPAVPATYRRLMEGQSLLIGGHTWRCISGWGHSPEHIALYSGDAQILISGDMVLPKISTNVSVYTQEPEANSLLLFLNSLKKFADVPADTVVMPSHGRVFRGLHNRIAQLVHHHEERLQDVLTACKEKPGSAHDMLSVIFRRPLDFHQTTFAMGESIAHLHALWYEGKMKRFQDEQGVWRFQTI